MRAEIMLKGMKSLYENDRLFEAVKGNSLLFDFFFLQFSWRLIWLPVWLVGLRL